MYAIIEISGKQYKVSPEDQIYIPYQAETAVGDSIVLSNVLLWADGDNIQVGQPHVAGAEAQAEVLGHVRGDKVIVFKKKRRKRYNVKRGHRQLHTRIQINELTIS